MKLRRWKCEIISDVTPPEDFLIPQNWDIEFGPEVTSTSFHLTERGARKFGDMVMAGVPLSFRRYIHYEVSPR